MNKKLRQQSNEVALFCVDHVTLSYSCSLGLCSSQAAPSCVRGSQLKRTTSQENEFALQVAFMTSQFKL